MAWFRISAHPDCFEIMEGVPTCMASSGEIPNGSDTDGIIYTSLSASIWCTCAPFRNPGKWKRSAMPRLATRSIMAFIMSPLPAITKRTFLVFANTRLAASTKYSGPFCMVIRPRNVTSLSLRGVFLKLSTFGTGSTALCTVVTLSGFCPYFSITVLRVRLLTHIIWSAISIPLRSMLYTVGFTLPRLRSKSVA